MNEMTKTDALLQALTEAHGTSGSEDAVRAIFARELQGMGSFTCDRLGSIQCELPGPEAPRVMVTAHMDEVGFAIQHITDKGFIQIVALGGWWTHSLLSQRVRLRGRRGEVLGIITSTPPHFLPESERTKVLQLEQLYIDVGASSRQEVEDDFGLRLGDPIVPESAYGPFGRKGNLRVAKAFDNRVGCGVVIETLQAAATWSDRSTTVCGVLTVQEEVGCRGSVTASALARPDVALILEGTPADDTPGTPTSAGGQGHLGRGVQIRLMDPTALMSRPLVEWLVALAEKHSIPFQIAVRRSGGTDAKSIHLHGLGVPSVVLGVPARYIHSHNSIIDLDDYRAAVALTQAAVKTLDAASVASFSAFLS
jgi:putative aminopeptidase FrvX